MSLDADCLAQLKLRQPPFDEVPSEDFLYSDPLLESLIETASRALQAPGAIVVLAGAEGSGRSVQLMRLLGALEEGFELIAFRGRANIPFDAIDVTIRNHLHAGGFDDPQRPLAALLGERARAGVALALAIDDAHLIGLEGIRTLLRIRAEVLEAGGQGLRLILVGDPAFGRGSLPLPDPMDDAQVVRLNLRPFNLEQAGAYLRHRLRVAGVEDPDAFLTSGDIAVLQTNSKGLPSSLNRNANAWLARRCRSAGGLQQVVGAKLASLTGSAKPRASRFEAPPDANPRPSAAPLDDFPEDVLDLDTELEGERPASGGPTDPELARYLVGEAARRGNDDFEDILKHVRQHQLEQTQAASAEASGTQEPARPKPPYWSRPWLIPALLALVLAAILIPVVLQLTGQSPGSSSEGTAQTAPRQPVSSPADEPASSQSPETAAVGRAETPATKEDEASVGAVESASTESGKEPEKEPGEPPPRGTSETAAKPAAAPSLDSRPDQVDSHSGMEAVDLQEDLSWLNRQDGERFTVQLVATGTLENAKAFLAPYDLSGVHYIQTRTYVIALIGSFPSRSLASKLLPELPRAVRDNGPWIRTIGAIRASLP